MRTIRIFLTFLAMAWFLPEAAAQVRSFVSGVGDDANPCSRTAPCKTYAGAFGKTSANGVIASLDVGSFGPVSIHKSITIGGAIEGSISSGLATGITVNAAVDDEVILRNLEIDGLGSGTYGIRILQAGTVYIENVRISDFAEAGIYVNNASAVRVFVNNVRVSDSKYGLLADAAGSPGNRIYVDESELVGNTSGGIRVVGGNSKVFLSNSFLANSGKDLQLINGGDVTSFRNNVIRSGAPNFTSKLK